MLADAAGGQRPPRPTTPTHPGALSALGLLGALLRYRRDALAWELAGAVAAAGGGAAGAESALDQQYDVAVQAAWAYADALAFGCFAEDIGRAGREQQQLLQQVGRAGARAQGGGAAGVWVSIAAAAFQLVQIWWVGKAAIWCWPAETWAAVWWVAGAAVWWVAGAAAIN